MRRLLIFVCCAALLLGQKPTGRVRNTSQSQPLPPPPALPPPDFPPDPWDVPLPPWPDDPPDPWDDPFDGPPEDWPLPDPPDLWPDDPSDPWNFTPDEWPEPPPPDLDLPSIFGEFGGSADVVGHSPLIFNAVPRRLAFFPFVASSGVNAAAPACDPKTGDTRVFLADAGRNRVLVYGSCPHRFLTAVSVGTFPSGVKSPPDGNTVWVTNLNSASISIIDAASYAVTASINLPLVDGAKPSPASISFNPDGSKAYVANHAPSGAGPVVFSIDVASKKVIGMLRVAPYPTAVRVTPDGAQVWITCAPDGVVYVFDTLSETLVTRIMVPLAGGLTFLPDGTKAYIGTVDFAGSVTVVNMITYKPITTIAVGNSPGTVIATPTGRHVFVGHLGSRFISIIGTNTDTVFRTIQTKSPTKVLAFLR